MELVQGNIVKVEKRGEDSLLLISHNNSLWRCQGKFDSYSYYSSLKPAKPLKTLNHLLGGRVTDFTNNTLIIINGDLTIELHNVENIWQLVNAKDKDHWLKWITSLWYDS